MAVAGCGFSRRDQQGTSGQHWNIRTRAAASGQQFKNQDGQGNIRTTAAAAGQQFEDQGKDARIRIEKIRTTMKQDRDYSNMILLEYEDNNLSIRTMVASSGKIRTWEGINREIL